MKRKKAGLYDPYLDTLGGGERHILSILKVLDDQDYHIDIFWNHNLKDEIKGRIDLHFKNLSFVPNIFRTKGATFQKLQSLKDYEYFFYVTDGSYFLSAAKKNYVFAMIPDAKLYTQSFINKLKTFNYRFICNSRFTQSYLQRFGIQAQICYPYIENKYIDVSFQKIKKQPIILSVGRFFPHLHSKRHDIAIKAFQKLKKDPAFKGFCLYLAGGLMNEDRSYFKSLEDLADGDNSIRFFPNIQSAKLFDLYKNSSFYWHCAGYGQDDTVSPEKVEHFGLTPLEAMACGTIPFCYNAGGPKEIIKESENGFLFDSDDELIAKTKSLLQKRKLYSDMQQTGKAFVTQGFSYNVFKKRVQSLL